MSPSATDRQLIRVGHSPDPDDAFMFYALAHDKLDTGDMEFRHQLEDIETLNQRALRGELEVSAVSIHAYSKLTDRYALLPTGSSMGDEYGPILVAGEPFKREDMLNHRIAVPGEMTTAFLALSLFAPDKLVEGRHYEVIPFDQIFQAIHDKQVDAGLIIHEGQLTYQNEGLSLIADMGVWWQNEHGLPLPLGGNVVRKDLGEERMRRISRLLRESIRYSLEHREAALDYAMGYARDMGRDLADRFVGMYVNDWTLDYGERGRAAIRKLLAEGAARGLVPADVQVEFVEDE